MLRGWWIQQGGEMTEKGRESSFPRQIQMSYRRGNGPSREEATGSRDHRRAGPAEVLWALVPAPPANTQGLHGAPAESTKGSGWWKHLLSTDTVACPASEDRPQARRDLGGAGGTHGAHREDGGSRAPTRHGRGVNHPRSDLQSPWHFLLRCFPSLPQQSHFPTKETGAHSW